MNLKYIDTHCHLDLFNDIQNNVVAEDSYPIKTISVTNAPFVYKPNKDLFKESKNIRVALGMHPELVAQYGNQITEFEKHLADTKYVGEIGLDGSKQHKDGFPLQKRILENILLQVAKKEPKTLTVHSRNAAAETVDLLFKHLKNTNSKVILHWYSGDKDTLLKALGFGFFFSINHKMTFSEKGSQIIQSLPLERILTETDAPFTFGNSVTNRLSSLKLTIKRVSEIRKKDEDEIKRLVFDNFRHILVEE